MQTRGASAMTMARTIVCYPAAFAVYFVCIGLLCPISAHTVAIKWAEGEVGKIVNISCEVTPEASNITWLFKGEPVTIGDRIKVDAKESLLSKDADGTELMKKTSIITVANATKHDAGNYTCVAQNGGTPKIASAYLDLYFPPKWIINTNRYDVVVSPEAGVNVSCVFEAYNVSVVRWRQQGYEDKPAAAYPDGVKRIKSTFHIPVHRPEDNGTYICEIQDRNKTAQGKVEVFVKAPPKVILNATGIGTTQIYLKWDVFAYNSDIKAYHLYYRENEDKKEFQQYTFERISPKNTSFVMRHGLKKATKYRLKLEIQTEFGSSKEGAIVDTATLDFEPVFVPNISINGFSATSVTIGWSPPNEKVAPFIHYYILEAKKKDEDVSRRAYHSRDGRNLPYMFDNLAPHSTYIFKVCACSDYTGQCGNWSDKMEAATLDGNPTKPTTVKAYCTRTFMNLTWGPPQRPNAEIKGYTMELTGNANFTDRYGNAKQVTWGPLSKFTTNDTRIVRFDDLQPNMHYTVRLSAMTRTRRRGDEETVSCNTQPAPPDHPPRPRWRKIIQDDRYMFKMYLPRISERNGPLCCYRVYMVRLLPNTDWNTLPPPKDIMVMTHREAHGQSAMLGAYITDVFSNDNFPLDSELVMGDEKSQYNKSESTLNKGICNRCFMPKKYEPITTTSTTTTSTSTSTSTTTEEYDEEGAEGITSAPETTESRNRRSYEKNFTSNPILADRAPGANGEKNLPVFDGPLDTSANYTLFVELITQIPNEPAMYSDYVNALMPAATPPAPQPTSTLEIALQATCAVAALVLLLMILFCIRQTRKSRKMPPHAHVEMNSLQAAFRKMFHVRSTHTPMVPPDMAPIPKDELAAAYAERQADSDYGFQKEFEMLPECFPDRTTHASETRENQPKNRYPDIKAYDQTRVKLSQIDGITGSDYINANYVMGYQDRKQFICAQGPTDATVNDFWRMIWEHGLELIVMLTNLEEYSKVKCSKYWPDEVRGSRAFGGLTVHHVTEKRYSDYIVRELKITKQPLNSEGQPIIENNGIAKRNGDCKEASEGSVPTSPRELKEPESRIVKQYHFLMWKDFAAPEHAYSILKFIKRVNEAWSGILNRACVVHCSAGVGRTGTLVALDCLLDQLRDVGHAAVFNTVAELRRSRNFLVQSLKQYVFVYRALVEYAHYGDTEIPANKLKSAIDRLRNTPPQAANCLMELEFEKILNSPIPEPIKSCAAGAAEELRPKNRSLDILPYDRNRVILAPIPGRDYSTYINASFIEAYDNSEGFIITQDPMPSTIMDFWRMVSEHNVTTIVMLSELGEGKCPRYWDDGTAQYEHISVQYEESESCPYYTRRQFRVVNNKSGCTSCVRHLQYQGWPTAPGHVPEVTRGLGELCDAAELQDPRAMLVHCHLGTERSALFVALCILICQLRTERRVDVCCVARKVRSQRLKTINTFLQYEFLHRAILNYAELHNLLEDS